MLALTAEIEIGVYVFRHVHQVRIESSRRNLVSTASIMLPRWYSNGYLTQVVGIGQKVNIKLGYNGSLNQEFTGYVTKIGTAVPVEIECEDEMYKLKRTEVKPKSWKSVKLSEVIKYVAPGAICEVPDISFTNYVIQGRMNAAKVLESLKDQYNLDVYYRPDSKLYVGIGLWEKSASNAVKYDTQLNVIGHDLKFRSAESVRIKMRLESHMPDGRLVTYETGDPDGELRTSNEYNMSLADLKKIADARIKEFKFSGLEGSLTTFGVPFVNHGNVASIHDKMNDSWDGRYVIDTVNTSFGIAGYRRTLNLGRRLS